jgi:hypothetical protein
MVFTPQTTAPNGNWRGQHTARWNENFTDPDFAIVGVVSFGDTDYMSQVFAHELDEMITDPGPNQTFPSSQSGMQSDRRPVDRRLARAGLLVEQRQGVRHSARSLHRKRPFEIEVGPFERDDLS